MTSTTPKLLTVAVHLTVMSGPDAGLTRKYDQLRVSLGRDVGNDFVLHDGFVSNQHGELVIHDNEVVYRDLGSRHGSLISMSDVSQHLHDSKRATQVRIQQGAEIQVGSTLIKVIIEYPGRKREAATLARAAMPQSLDSDVTERLAPKEEEEGSGFHEKLITTVHNSVQAIDGRFESNDKRLAVLFKLAGQLNGLTALDDIMDLIVEATFDAFPAANFFAVTLVNQPEKVGTTAPFLTRVRGKLSETKEFEEPIISTSILKRVIETRESVLFVKDSLGTNVSQSILDAKITACLCAPLVGQRSLLGVMQVDTRGRGSLFSRQDLDLFSILASNVAFAIERARLSESIMEMFEGFVAASVNAVEARDPVTAGHSERVARYTLELAEVVNEIAVGELKDIHLKPNELTELRYAALLHDFGKIAVREDVLQKNARLPGLQMQLIHQRFETIKEVGYKNLLRRYARQLEAGKASNQGMVEVEAQYEIFARELNDIFQFLQEVAEAPGLNDEQIARVRKIGERQYIDSTGARANYLTASEIENLCIRRGTLNELEWDNMRSHAAFSEAYLERIPWSEELRNIPCIAGAHHEKLDGTGYPHGLSEPQILPQVRMLTISDIFDAVTASDRPYRKAAPIERAMRILEMEADDNKLDRHLVGVFVDVVIPRINHIIPSR